MKFIQYLFLGFFLLLFLSGLTAQQDINGSFEHDGETRDFIIHLPTGYQDGVVLPMVINMHGFGSNNFQQQLYTSFDLIADAENFIVVYPQGLVRTTAWGATGASWDAYFGTGVDDLGFLDKLIDHLYTFYNIDLARVYATGMSNGGFMSYRLACELSERIAAIASVTGAMVFQQFNNCTPDRPVPIMEVHGTSDNTVPYSGIQFLTPSIPEVVAFWVEHNNCITPQETTDIPDINMTDNTTTSIDAYTCDDDTEVLFYTIQNGGHTWPGAVPIPSLGNTSLDFIGSQHIWDFFDKHSHPNPKGGTLLADETPLTFAPEGVSVFPNPANETLFIRYEQREDLEVRILNVAGQPIREYGPLEGRFFSELSIAGLATGMYFIEVKTPSSTSITKIYKQ